jgi:hypothetical protein
MPEEQPVISTALEISGIGVAAYGFWVQPKGAAVL